MRTCQKLLLIASTEVDFMKNKLTFIILLSLCVTIVGADSIGKFQDYSQTNEILKGVQGYLIQPGDAKGSILGGRHRVSSRTLSHGQKARTTMGNSPLVGRESCDGEIRRGDTLLRSSPQDILWDSREGREEMKPAFIALCLWCVELK
jgi:hypothetical protein